MLTATHGVGTSGIVLMPRCFVLSGGTGVVVEDNDLITSNEEGCHFLVELAFVLLWGLQSLTHYEPPQD